MDQADIRTSVTSSDFWWAASTADLKFLLRMPRARFRNTESKRHENI